MKVKTQVDVTVPPSTFTLVSETMKPVTETDASKLKVVLLICS